MRQKGIVCILLAVFAVIYALVNQDVVAQAPTGLTYQKEPTTDNTSDYKQFLLFLPPEYYSESSKKWPLLVYLHGGGGDIGNLKILMSDSLPNKLKNESDLPFVVVAPHCAQKQFWRTEMIKGFIDYITNSITSWTLSISNKLAPHRGLPLWGVAKNYC